MNALLFDEVASTIHRVGLCKKSKFGHAFGGPPRHTGITVSDFPPAQLLYMLDLTDPRIGLQIPGVQWLPLYYALRNVEGKFSYRIISDSKIQILSKPYKGEKPAAVQHDFPKPLESQPVDLEEYPYDPHRLKDAYTFAGIFGLDKLPEKDKARAIKKLKKEWKWREEVEGAFPNSPASLDEMLYWIGGTTLVQGHPRSPCPNPGCEFHSYNCWKPPYHYQGKLRFLLALFPEKNDQPLYQEIGGGNLGELNFEFCPKCYSVVATNPCT